MVGLGHVGLPTAVHFAEAGRRVVGVDVDEGRLEALRCRVALAEPGLDTALEGALQSGRLTLSSEPGPADAYIVCVPTPLGPNHTADLRALYDAVDAIGRVAAAGALLVIGSTVPVGTTEAVARRAPDLRVACCPERVLPGDTLRELVANDRLVGGVDAAATQAACALWEGVVDGAVVPTTARAAELAKLVENAARDVQIALAHTMSDVAQAHAVDPDLLWSLVQRHPRVSLLEAGIGVGGHCLPVDPWFLVASAPQQTALLRAARAINDQRPSRIVEDLRLRLPKNDRIAILGLTYKPDVADLRHAPALQIARALSREYDVVVTDPLVPIPPDLPAASLQDALQCRVLVILVAHTAYRGLVVQPGQEVHDLVGALA